MLFPHEVILGINFSSPLVEAFPHITRGLRPLVIWGNASTRGEEKLIPRIASCGKITLLELQRLVLEVSKVRELWDLNNASHMSQIIRPPSKAINKGK